MPDEICRALKIELNVTVEENLEILKSVTWRRFQRGCQVDECSCFRTEVPSRMDAYLLLEENDCLPCLRSKDGKEAVVAILGVNYGKEGKPEPRGFQRLVRRHWQRSSVLPACESAFS